MRTLWASTLLSWTIGVAGCSALVAPDPARLEPNGGVDSGRDGLDVGVRDAAMPTDDATVTSDAFTLEDVGADVDAFEGPCVPGCEGGRVCRAGVCTCPPGLCCPGCSDTEACLGGTCVSCGGLNQVCCGGGSCFDANALCLGGRCASCGGTGEPCCADGGCRDGAACESGTCAGDCGANGQPCCPGDRCEDGTVCAADFLPFTRSCHECGAIGEPCCAGRLCTADASVCDRGGNCSGCGGLLEACCPGDRCRDSRSCTAGRCT